VKLTDHSLHFDLWLGIHGAIPPLLHTSSGRGAKLSTGYIFMTWYLVKDRDNFYLCVNVRIFLCGE